MFCVLPSCKQGFCVQKILRGTDLRELARKFPPIRLEWTVTASRACTDPFGGWRLQRGCLCCGIPTYHFGYENLDVLKTILSCLVGPHKTARYDRLQRWRPVEYSQFLCAVAIFCYFCFTKFWLESNGASVDLEARRHLFVASLIWAWCRISLNPTHCLICSTNICFFGFGENGKCSTTARFVHYTVVHVCELKMFHQKGCSRLASRVCSRQGNVSPDGEDSFGRVSSWQICLPGARNSGLHVILSYSERIRQALTAEGLCAEGDDGYHHFCNSLVKKFDSKSLPMIYLADCIEVRPVTDPFSLKQVCHGILSFKWS